ncbi:MAG TPA: ComF family protein [Methylomirabilota bacterium]|nr:ComF family protein [Methylomirabilota bacterium]
MPSLEYLSAVASARPPWRGWAGALLDLVFPPFCPVCDDRLGEGRRDPLCARCWARLERIEGPVCRTCGLPMTVPGICGACRRRRPAFAYARAAARYGDVVREALHAFKFGGRRALAAPLADLLAAAGPAWLPAGAPDLILPVPLHPRRERERGFNQAVLLARRIGRAWGRSVREDVLRRTIATLPQTDLGLQARRANVRGAFALRRSELVAGRHVLVVDDVFTTGATVGECARCLYKAGAARVGVLTVARVT